MAKDGTTINVIAPNLPPEGAIIRAEPPEWVESDDVRVIGYPKFLFEYEMSMNRIFMSDRVVNLSITVDAVTGGRLRNDEYPELETRTYDRQALLQPRLRREEAIDKAKSVVRRYISFHFPGYVMLFNLPEMDIIQDDFVFLLYWLVPMNENVANDSRVTILNTMTGNIVEENLEIEDLTPERLST